MRLPQPPLLVITDRRQARAPLETVVHQALEGGCRWFSLREKDLLPADRLALLQCLVAVGQPYGATIGVHGDIEAALGTSAQHLHLPRDGNVAAARRRLSENTLIGVSAHDPGEVASAQRRGADYCTLSPIFPSPSKPGYGPVLGSDGLASMVRRHRLPIIALGGIEIGTVDACLAAGAAGIAVMGSVMRAEDPQEATRRLITALKY